jgi:hypothetical protein
VRAEFAIITGSPARPTGSARADPNETTIETTRRTEMTIATGEEKKEMLRANPAVAQVLAQYGGDAEPVLDELAAGLSAEQIRAIPQAPAVAPDEVTALALSCWKARAVYAVYQLFGNAVCTIVGGYTGGLAAIACRLLKAAAGKAIDWNKLC